MRPQRVRVLVNNLHPYGAQRVAMTVSRAMRDLGHGPELLLWDEPTGSLQTEWAGIPVQRLQRGRGGLPGFIRQTVELASILRSDPTPVLGVLTYSNILALTAARLARSSSRIVASEHNLTSVAMTNTDSRARLKFALMRRLYTRAAGIVAVSDDVTHDLVELLTLPPNSVTTILNPVDLRLVREEAEGPAPHPWLGDPSLTTVVCPGALRKAKGQSRLLRALVHLDKVHAIFVGDGAELASLQACARDLGIVERVEFVGWQENPYPWMRAADAVAIPSRWEGFGLVAVEAAALGVPVVGSDCAGLGEILRMVGARAVPQTGPYDDVEHAQLLAIELRDALEAPAPAHRLDAFEPSAAARQYAALLGL